MDKALENIIAALDDKKLGELAEHVGAVVEARRAKVGIDIIKPGMSAEDAQRVRDEIRRVLHNL